MQHYYYTWNGHGIELSIEEGWREVSSPTIVLSHLIRESVLFMFDNFIGKLLVDGKFLIQAVSVPNE